MWFHSLDLFSEGGTVREQEQRCPFFAILKNNNEVTHIESFEYVRHLTGMQRVLAWIDIYN